jgi:hypothetical protein
MEYDFFFAPLACLDADHAKATGKGWALGIRASHAGNSGAVGEGDAVEPMVSRASTVARPGTQDLSHSSHATLARRVYSPTDALPGMSRGTNRATSPS